MSDVTEKMIEEQENLTVVELTDQELEEVNGAWGDFCPFNNSTSLALTTIAFTTNNGGIF
ncbi:MAG TPA: hypothetical protein VGL94_12245 [Ktedonobacteraceae bacterium]